MAEAVVTDNTYARAFLNVRLGRIIRARSADDIRKGDLAASADGKYAHGRGIEYRRLPQIPRLGKSVRDQQIAQLTERQRDFDQRVTAAKDVEVRLLAALEAIRRAEAVLVTNKDGTIRTLEAMQAADLEHKRQAELIADLEAELPKGVREEKREIETMLGQYQQEQRDEEAKEKGPDRKNRPPKGAMNTNAEVRKKAADKALEAFPPYERRLRRHDSPIGLERFARRARAVYQRSEATASIQHRFATVLKRSSKTRPRRSAAP